ncbi:hypothetical protein M011DRAFT_228822 [Sporormia fimetaria CBS 119925]|uniref:Uncharacterized protein n=1 Tax=Sporormia fimetaria CBS 119925 TaxID=1340428 RepID=A0A6A6VKH7_9PLEO|nr:hypothetical protein M011DRAFT_228822 [Sporormia fimetaria CBS 119925]
MTSATTSKSNATPTFPAVPQTSEARGSQPIPDVLYEDATKPPPRSPEPGDSTPSSPVPKVKRRFWKRRDYDQSEYVTHLELSHTMGLVVAGYADWSE